MTLPSLSYQADKTCSANVGGVPPRRAGRSLTAWLFAALIVAAGLAACGPTTDVAAVKQYAQVTSDASAAFASIAVDFGESCLRQREFTLREADMPRTLTELAPAYPPAPTPQPTTAPPATSFDDPQCLQARSVGDEWRKRNAVIVGYVQALGAIAGVDVQPSFAPLGTALVGAKLITLAQDTAFTTIASELTASLVAARKRDAIAKTVIAVDPSLRVAIDALKTVDAAYAQELNAEYNLTFDFYNALIRSELPNANATASPAMRATIYAQRQTYTASLEAVNARRASTIAYANVLDAIETTDGRLLAQARASKTIAEYVAILNTDILPLYANVEALRKVTK